MENTVKFLEIQNFYLPKFAYWKLIDWKIKGNEIDDIIKNKLGWDITDYGSGNFSKNGLIHFTVRNGDPKDALTGGKPYCEKIMIIKEGQMTPLHHHQLKIEDIINRSGGTLLIEVYNVSQEEKLDNSDVKISIDGEQKHVKAGSVIELKPGESITIFPNHYHRFWAKDGNGKVLIGEVSSVNDDYKDNKFLTPTKRFTEIEEDEDPLYLLSDDYIKFLKR